MTLWSSPDESKDGVQLVAPGVDRERPDGPIARGAPDGRRPGEGNPCAVPGPVGSRAVTAGPSQQGVHLAPKLAPRRPLVLGELVQGLPGADTGQVKVGLPALHRRADRAPRLVGP